MCPCMIYASSKYIEGGGGQVSDNIIYPGRTRAVHCLHSTIHTAAADDHQRNECSHRGREGPCVIKGEGEGGGEL